MSTLNGTILSSFDMSGHQIGSSNGDESLILSRKEDLSVDQLLQLIQNSFELIEESNKAIRTLQTKGQRSEKMEDIRSIFMQKQTDFLLELKSKAILTPECALEIGEKISKFGSLDGLIPHQLVGISANLSDSNKNGLNPSPLTASLEKSSSNASHITSNNLNNTPSIKIDDSSSSFSTDITAKILDNNVISGVSISLPPQTNNQSSSIQKLDSTPKPAPIAEHAIKKFDVTETKAQIDNSIQQLMSYEKSKAQEQLQTTFLSIEKPQYGTDSDLRYYITQKLLETFDERLLQYVSSSNKIMLRVNNWLRYDLKNKVQDNIEASLKFIKALKLSETQLSSYKLSEIIKVIVNKYEGSIKELLHDILNQASEKTNQENKEREERLQKISKTEESKENKKQEEKKTSEITTFQSYAYLKKQSALDKSNNYNNNQDLHLDHNTTQRVNALNGNLKSILKPPSNQTKILRKRKNVSFAHPSKLTTIHEFQSENSFTKSSNQYNLKSMEDIEAMSLKDSKRQERTQGQKNFEKYFKEELYTKPWSTPQKIDLTCIREMEEPVAETRGGVLKFNRTDDTHKFIGTKGLPSFESPAEPKGLITSYAEYSLDEYIENTLHSEEKASAQVINLPTDKSLDLQVKNVNVEQSSDSINQNPDQDVLNLIDDENFGNNNSVKEDKEISNTHMDLHNNALIQTEVSPESIVAFTEKLKMAFLEKKQEPNNNIVDSRIDSSDNIPHGVKRSRDDNSAAAINDENSVGMNQKKLKQGTNNVLPNSSGILPNEASEIQVSRSGTLYNTTSSFVPPLQSYPSSLYTPQRSGIVGSSSSSLSANNGLQSFGQRLSNEVDKGFEGTNLNSTEQQKVRELRSHDSRRWVQNFNPNDFSRYAKSCTFYHRGSCNFGTSCRSIHNEL